ncbi:MULTISPECIES: UDP-N-acetylmuramate--L-alanine ligase [Niastella]|uniref:UDP-N-acetylmuramate--L-alanine ligase n=1 Tax=Niastella soli TaxID=2821487 RepID=A0ABS3YS58_9BACT|nr:UDP-N-acetylmuramate--L-alanine ligase [Niastella soli]MBO9200737.1 UDP-N-acetylmuramate--L-alanine ligase [Niastella soli]
MVDIKDINKVYFLGIGGIGMSALARYFKFHGKEVSGYDKTETPLTKQLVSEGIPVHYDDNLDLAPKDAQLVVYTPAVPKGHTEFMYYQQNNYPLLKRSEVLGAITRSSFNICVAGTHGKTTMTTMVAHILRHSEYGCNAFLGGIAVNYNSNYWSDERDTCVVEADEYDRSFLRLTPDVAVISAMDPDHLDIYGTTEAMEEAFIEFAGKIKPGGLLISKYGLPRGNDLKAPNQLTYHLENTQADIYACNIQMEHGTYVFDVQVKDWKLTNVVLNMGGLHNIENVIAAIAIAHHLGISATKIKAAVEAFRGVRRRFEYVIKDKDVTFVDDYAHHPEELRALITGAKGLFGNKKCTVLFQPHLFTRTRDLASEFAEVLDMADEVVLLPIYPARELPIPGVTSNTILDKMKNDHKQVLDKAQLLQWVKTAAQSASTKTAGGWLLITAGAGDIDTLVQPIKQIIETK